MNEGIYQGLSRSIQVYITVYMYTMYDHNISESFNQSEISLMNLILYSSPVAGLFCVGLQGLVIYRKKNTSRDRSHH